VTDLVEESLMTLRDRGTGAVDPPEPDLTPAEMIARAAALRGKLRERQDECERLGRLPDATLQDYRDAGLYRVMQPRRFGGYGFGLDTFLRAAVELSRGCPSSGWAFALTATHSVIIGLFEERGQVELFGDGEFRCPGSALPAPAVKVDAGYRISGWWDYASGCDVATHFMGGAGVVAEPGGEVVDTRFVVMRRDQFQIVDNWDTLGMRGTGSRRVVVEDLFIPEHHTAPSPNPLRPIVKFPGHGLHQNPAFYGPLASLLISEPAAVSVGIAKAAIDEYLENLTTKHQWGPTSPKRSELPVFQRLLGEATAYADTAEAALHQVAQKWAELARRSMETGEPVSDEDDRRLILIEQQIVQLASKAAETIFRTSGSSASKKGQRIERYFRDLNMIRTHVTLQFERTWENVGRLRLGLQPEMQF
jgi:3-hydroxy-9,10-secoandrosta-1,3,5(10)-triene-9,17-dione monooxygenase